MYPNVIETFEKVWENSLYGDWVRGSLLRTFEEHLKRKIQDPSNIEHFFQVCLRYKTGLEMIFTESQPKL